MSRGVPGVQAKGTPKLPTSGSPPNHVILPSAPPLASSPPGSGAQSPHTHRGALEQMVRARGCIWESPKRPGKEGTGRGSRRHDDRGGTALASGVRVSFQRHRGAGGHLPGGRKCAGAARTGAEPGCSSGDAGDRRNPHQAADSTPSWHRLGSGPGWRLGVRGGRNCRGATGRVQEGPGPGQEFCGVSNSLHHRPASLTWSPVAGHAPSRKDTPRIVQDTPLAE